MTDEIVEMMVCHKIGHAFAIAHNPDAPKAPYYYMHCTRCGRIEPYTLKETT